MKAIDPLTQEEFMKRRNNQKFASSENRIMYNNQKARRIRETKAPIQRMLDQNRNILCRILGDKNEVSVSRDYLLGAGLYFNYYSYVKEIDGVTYIGIYNFGITKLKDGRFKIIKI